MALLITIDANEGTIRQAAFSASPVRVGRNPLNELRLDDPLVSQWHAVVHFELLQGVPQMTWIDLDSTNGTFINEQKIEPRTARLISPNDVVRVGQQQLTVTVTNVSPELLRSPNDTVFDLQSRADRPGRDSQPLDRVRTLLWGQPAATPDELDDDLDDELEGDATVIDAPAATSSDLSTSGTWGGPTVVARPDQLSGRPPAHLEPLGRVLQDSLDACRPAFEAYRTCRSEAARQLMAWLQNVAQPNRGHVVTGLHTAFPEISREPEFRRVLRDLGLEATLGAEVDLRDWLQRLKYGSSVPAEPESLDQRQAMERVGALLETFAESFVSLRRGYEDFAQEMAIAVVQERTPLSDARDHQAFLKVLLDWPTDGERALHDLKRAFTDLAIHQIALMHGVIEGMRATLNQLAPSRLAQEQSLPGPSSSAKKGLLFHLRRLRPGSAWRRYQQLHLRLMEEDRFVREVFGDAFARAYQRIAGGHLPKKHRPSGVVTTAGAAPQSSQGESQVA